MMGNNPNACPVWGNPGSIHITTVGSLGKKSSQSYCVEHLPTEILKKSKIPATAAEEVAHLRRVMGKLDQKDLDPVQREQFKAELEQLIREIEAGRRRLYDDPPSSPTS